MIRAHNRKKCYLFILFAMIVLSFAGSPSRAAAMSSACAWINSMNAQTDWSRSFSGSAFQPDEILSVSGTDNGGGVGGDPTTADAVLVSSGTFVAFFRHTSDVGPAGAFSTTTPNGYLRANGLFVRVKAKTYISGVSVSCRSAVAAPVAGSSSATVSANSSANNVPLNLSGGAVASVAIAAQAAHGVATASGTTISYTPTAGYSGSDSFTYTASNAGGTSPPATVNITVTPPTLAFTPAGGALPAGTTGAAYNQTFTVTGGGAPYSYAVTAGALPAGLTLATNGVLSGSPTAAGTASFTITARDAHGATGSAAYTLAVSAAAPTITSISPNTGPTAGMTDVVITGTNLAGATALRIGGIAVSFTIDSATQISTTTPPHAAGPVDVMVRTPGGDATAAGGFTYVAPLKLSPADMTELTQGIARVAYSDTSISASGGFGAIRFEANGLPPGLAIDSATGAISGTPTSAGHFIFSVTARDEKNAEASTAYQILIDIGTPAPVANSVSATVAANSSTNPITLKITGGAPDSVAIADQPQHGTATASGTSITYTPTAGYSGPDSFTYTATNATGTSAPATVTITVTPPTLLLSPAAGALSDGSAGVAYSQTVSASGGTAPYTYAVTAGSLPAGLSLDAATGEISGTPTTAGNASFTITATDTNGAIGSAAYTLAIADAAAPSLVSVSPNIGSAAGNQTVTLTGTNLGGVTSVYFNGTGATIVSKSPTQLVVTTPPSTRTGTIDIHLFVRTTRTIFSKVYTYVGPPVANGSTATVAANSSANPITLKLTGDAATSVAIVSQAAHGAATASGTSITYTPTAGYSGTDSFTYTATNAAGTSAPATVTITVTAPRLVFNPAAGPLASATTGLAYSASISVSAGTAPYSYTVTSGALPAGLSLDPATGTISGTPTVPGVFNFTIGATDAHSATASAAYALEIVAGLRPPAANSVSATVAANSSANPITLNITGGAPDSVAVPDQPQHGTVNIAGLNVTYTPTPGYSGPDSFTYTATNAAGTSAAATVTITVTPLPLTVSPATGSTLTAGQVGVAYSDTLISATGGSGAISFTATGLPAGLTMAAATGAIRGTPTVDGTFSVAVTATSATSGSASATYSLVIAMAPPSLAAVSPGSGPTAGSTEITVSGSHLTGATSVMVGGVAATSVKVVSDTEIKAKTPANTAGAVDVMVTTPGGTATLPAAFTYVAPTFTFAPASGTIAGGTAGVRYEQPITVTGGTPAYRFSATGLPDGMWIDPSSGTLSGLPTTPGDYVIVVTVTDQAGRTGTATYSLSLDGIYRPDPTQDPEVAGLLNAQAQSAQRLATTQISNFNDRLERLHTDQERQAHSFNIRLGVTQQPDNTPPLCSTRRNGSEAPISQAQCSEVAGRTVDPVTGRQVDPTTGRPIDTVWGSTAADGPAEPVPTQLSNTAFWAGGFVNFGTNDEGNLNLSNTLVGVSGGVDHRFTPDFVAGMGLGYGRDKNEIGDNGTETTGQAISAAIYGSYHPSPLYLDGLVGVSRLDFDSTRFVTTTGDFALGSRNGTQLFASLTAGYEHRANGLLFSPYGRVQTAWTRLDDFTETGAGPYSLAFGGQSFEMLAGVVGLRAEYALPMDWGVLNTRGRFEYTHDFAGSSQAALGYADLGTKPYTLDLNPYMRDYLTVGLGVDAKLDDLTVGFDYRTSFGFDGSAQNHSFGLRLDGHF
jgi:uncharacterized protein YhjY with autotransporter beta-barrel domain